MSNLIDLYVALGMLILVVVVFIISRITALPRQTLPFVVGAFAAVIGITVLTRQRTNGLRKELEKREKELQEREKKLAELKNDYQISEEQLQQVKAKLQEQREAYEKMMLQIQAKNEAEKERIEHLKGEELHHEFSDFLKTL